MISNPKAMQGTPTPLDGVGKRTASKGPQLDSAALRGVAGALPHIERGTTQTHSTRMRATMEAKDSSQPSPKMLRLSDVQSRKINWLWEGRIALGKLTMIVGDPGLGKSNLTVDIASRISTGRNWADGSQCERGSVIFVSAEDDVEDTIKPRLDAAGADSEMIAQLVAITDPAKGDKKPKDRHFCIGTDIEPLEQAIVSMPSCKAIIIDPVSAYMGKADSHKNAEVRAILALLADCAARHSVAIIAITHLNKNAGTQSISLASGQIGKSDS